MTLNIFSHERTVIDCMSDKAPESGPLDPIRGFQARVDAEDVNHLKKLDINSISHIFISELSNGKGAVGLFRMANRYI